MSVVAIIPAYNEEKTIGEIIETLKSVKAIDRIIVVSDASTDRTAQVARNYEAEVIELDKNRGKGGAIKAGFDKTWEDVLLFIDADLIGLRPHHVMDLIQPIIDKEADMTIGVFEKGRFATDFAQKVAPFLSGQRAVSREIFKEISDLEFTRYGIEMALTKYVESSNLKAKKVTLKDVTHIMKEEKLGLIKGFTARMKMYLDIIKYIVGHNNG
jgi:glycosyltransferase involved in cell wall biosynthesis